jgi:hypothetical protein
MFLGPLHRHNESSAMAYFNHEERESNMSKYINSSADILPEGSVSRLNPYGSSGGVFSLRRARYFNEAGFDLAGRGVRDTGIAEETITEAATGCDQAELDKAVGPVVCVIASDSDTA